MGGETSSYKKVQLALGKISASTMDDQKLSFGACIPTVSLECNPVQSNKDDLSS